MLHELGYSRLEDFISDVLPESIKLTEVFGQTLPEPASEPETINELRALASKNRELTSLIGMGY